MPESKFEANIKDQSEDKEGKLSKHLVDAITKLRGRVTNDKSNMETWKRKMIIANNQRLGVKRKTDFPYTGAPDVPVPETDKVIKKSTPALILSAWAPKKKVLVTVEDGTEASPQLKEKAKRSELAMNSHITSTKVDFLNKITLAADYAKQYGHCIYRVFEEFKTTTIHKVIDLEEFPEEEIENLKTLSGPQKELFIADRFNLDPEEDKDKEIIADIIKQFNDGKKIIEFDMEEISSFPNFEVPLPTKVIVPNYATDIDTCPRITYEIFRTRQQMEEKFDDETFIRKDLNEIKVDSPSKDDDDLNEQRKGWDEGITSQADDSELYRLHIVNTYYKPDKDGKAQRWVFVFFADVGDAETSLLYSKPFHFEFETWDYDKYDNEVKDPRFHNSRGEPEMIRGLHEIMEKAINNMLIRDEINNMPMWEVLNTSDILDTHTTMRPGKKLPVTAIGQEIAQLNQNTKVDLSSERIMQIVKANIEEYRGITDQLFRNATNAGGGKTLGEIQEGVKQTLPSQNLDVIRFNNTLSKVYKKMFLIFKERIGKPMVINGITVTRDDFDFPAEVKSNGNLEVADADRATQKAMNRLQVAVNMEQAGISDKEDTFNAYQDWLEKDGVKEPDKFSTDPKQIMQTQLAQLQQQVQQLGQQAQQLQEANITATKELARTKKADVKGKIMNIEEAKAEQSKPPKKSKESSA